MFNNIEGAISLKNRNIPRFIKTDCLNKKYNIMHVKNPSIWKKYLITEISVRGEAICQPPHIKFMLSKNKFHEYMVFDYLIVDFAK